MPRAWSLTLAIATALAAGACSRFQEMRQALAGLQDLQAGLIREFNEPNIAVNISNRSALTVTFVNSALATLPEDQRASEARRVAEFVRDHYVGYSTVTRVAIGFQTKASVGVASASRTEVPYSFSPAQLGPSPERQATDSAAGSSPPAS